MKAVIIIPSSYLLRESYCPRATVNTRKPRHRRVKWAHPKSHSQAETGGVLDQHTSDDVRKWQLPETVETSVPRDSGKNISLYPEVHYWKAVSLCFPHNRGEVLQVG